MNLVVVAGHIAAPPELRVLDSGTRMLRYLVTTKSARPRARVDVLPIVLWDPADALVERPGEPGMRLWSVGAVQRRFWQADDGRRSRLEIVAHQVELRTPVDARPDEEDAVGDGVGAAH